MRTFLYCLIGVMIFQTGVWLIAAMRRNNGIADIAWGMGFIIIIVVSYVCRRQVAFTDPDWSSQLVMSILVMIWALRLSVYLCIRNWGKEEDWRYAQWRRDWGSSFLLRSYLQVFLLQGLLMLLVGSPIVLAYISPLDIQMGHGRASQILLVVGVLVWLFGFYWQAVGDHQLMTFKSDQANKGLIMRQGLWQYTRHPNYFGEATMWWGIYLISTISATDIEGLLLRTVGPLVITYLLLRVSGVVMLESKYAGNAEYQQYISTTSAFIPWRKNKN